MRKRILWITVGFAGFLVVAISFYSLGDLYATRVMVFKRVTPTQAANAMQGDHFYSDYRRATLIVTGKVHSVRFIDGTPRISFETNVAYGAECDLATSAKGPKVGDTITVLSQGGRAGRQPKGVLLTGCTVVPE